AGAAGLIKTAMAVHNRTLPPTTGCEDPISELSERDSPLRVLKQGIEWPAEIPLRAGISGMGFGGINTHLVIEGIATARRRSFDFDARAFISSHQDAELFLLTASNNAGLLAQTEHLLKFSSRLSNSEMSDLACAMEKEVRRKSTASLAGSRAAIVADTASNLTRRLETLRAWLRAGLQQETSLAGPSNGSVTEVSTRIDAQRGLFLGSSPLRIGFLFPGQSSPVYLDGGALAKRFESVQRAYSLAKLPGPIKPRTGASNHLDK